MPIYQEQDITGITKEFLARQEYNYWKTDELFAPLFHYLLDETDESIYRDKLSELEIFIKDIKTLHQLQGRELCHQVLQPK